MRSFATLAFALALLAGASGQITPQQNYKPVDFTANSDPYTIIATPITPNAPYSQAAYQCNITGDSRYPAGGTFPLTVRVPVGKMVRIVFANGNLGGSSPVTQQGTAGVIVQQGGAVIVQQSGGASPIVQNVGSPVVQQNAPPAALVVQQTPTVVQPGSPSAPTVSAPPAYGTYAPRTPTPAVYGRRLLQDRVPGGPNNGLVEYVALASSNNVPGFVVPNTQFGVPYVEFTATAAAQGQVATFRGVLEVAVVQNGQPVIPFTPNKSLSPECQVNVNLQVA